MMLKMTTPEQQKLMKLAFDKQYSTSTTEDYPKVFQFTQQAREEARYRPADEHMSAYQRVIAQDAYDAIGSLATAHINPDTGELTVVEDDKSTPARLLAALELEGVVVVRTTHRLQWAHERRPLNPSRDREERTHEYALRLV